MLGVTETFKRMVKRKGLSVVAKEMHISISTLSNIMNGKRGVGSKVICAFVITYPNKNPDNYFTFRGSKNE